MPRSTTLRDALCMMHNAGARGAVAGGFQRAARTLDGFIGVCRWVLRGDRYAEGFSEGFPEDFSVDSSAFFSLSAVTRFRGTCVVHT